MGRHDGGGPERESGRAPHLFGQLSLEQVDDVGLAALEHGQARGLVRNRLEHETLDARALSPVRLVRFEHELHAGVERDEPVRTGTDGSFLEAVVADLLEVLLGHDPAGAGGEASVIGHEIGPGLLETEAHPGRIGDLHDRDFLFQQPCRGAPIPLERELHVVGDDRIAVVEPGALAKDELVHEAVLRHAPGFGQARSHGVAGHRLHQRVVQSVEDHERRADPRGLGGVEPRGGQRNVNGPGHLTFRCRRGRRGSDDRDRQDERCHEEASSVSHVHLTIPRRPRPRRGRALPRPRVRSIPPPRIPAPRLGRRAAAAWGPGGRAASHPSG